MHTLSFFQPDQHFERRTPEKPSHWFDQFFLTPNSNLWFWLTGSGCVCQSISISLLAPIFDVFSLIGDESSHVHSVPRWLGANSEIQVNKNHLPVIIIIPIISSFGDILSLSADLVWLRFGYHIHICKQTFHKFGYLNIQWKFICIFSHWFRELFRV